MTVLSFTDNVVYDSAVLNSSTAEVSHILNQWLAKVSKIEDSEIKSPLSQAIIRLHADELLDQTKENLKTIQELEAFVCNADFKNKISLSTHLSIKLAKSKALVSLIDTPLQFSFVIPVYQEDIRMLPNKPTEKHTKKSHAEGEGFVLEKYRQMSWLFKDSKKIKWHIYYVDDGCDRNSGDKIAKALESLDISKHCDVLKLKDALVDPTISSILQEFSSEKESKKAGAVYAGMQHALNKGADIVGYSDADLSYDLGLSGYLLYPIQINQADIVTAHRGHDLSIIQKQTNTVSSNYFELGKIKMKTLLSIFRHELFGHLLPSDTQPGFKAFRSSSIAQALHIPGKETGFAFDMQLLARLSYLGKRIQVCPVVCLDSSVHSTADNEKTYFDMLATLTRIASDIRTEKNSIIGLINSIIDTKDQDRATVWAELLRLFGESEEQLKLNTGYDIDLILEIQKDLSYNGNNTALTKPYSKDVLENVALLVAQIKSAC